jgi:hypothetical protein
MRSFPGTLGLFIWLCLVTVDAHARLSLLDEYPSLQPVGSGGLTWWGIRVYQATLYAPLGQYRPDRPHTLEIVYRMGISREKLAKTSLREIEKIRGAPLADRQGVLNQFKTIFYSIAP